MYPTTTTTTTTTTKFLFLLTLLSTFTPNLLSYTHHRHLLHEPLFPSTTVSPTESPSLSPQQHQPKYPFSSFTPTTSTTPSTSNEPFFPSYPSPSPPPPPSSSSVATFPANISALIFPDPPSKKPISPKLLAAVISVSVLASVLIAGVVVFLFYRRRHNLVPGKISRSDSIRLYPSNTPSSDGGPKPPPVTELRRTGMSNVNSSEFLYLGTLVNSRGIDDKSVANSSNVSSSSPYRKLGSPELRPLPPLPRQIPYPSGEMCTSKVDTDDDNDEFFSPRGSYSDKDGLHRPESGLRPVLRSVETEDLPDSSSPSSNSVSPLSSLPTSPPLPMNSNPGTFKSSLVGSSVNFPAPSRPPPPPPSKSLSPLQQKAQSISPMKLPPPPPTFPPPKFWEINAGPQPTLHHPCVGPPTLITPTRPIMFQNGGSNELSNQNAEIIDKNAEPAKPKLKPLHWDKVRASSSRAMVWDQLKSSSFQLNEEMIETLFKVNATNLNSNDRGRYAVLPLTNQGNQVLDPKKSQNIAILLRALNVTVDEVCEALSEGNTDTLGTELLESLLKMAPTKEEERKLKEFKDESPLKLGTAEKFLRAVLDIPFAFKRVDAMLYIASFDSEIEYLHRSFETLEVACQELRNSRMFQKLLEAVLKTGNRMNVGTNRGDAHAFKLDTLLKLVDVRGTDGKTTLLHFVVQEIIKAEGSRVRTANQNTPINESHQPSFQDEVELRKLGLQIVSSLSGELTNVKKSAAMDFDILSNEVSKLSNGITKIKQIVNLNEEPASKNVLFFKSMDEFLTKAEEKITKIEAHKKTAQSLVKELTEYFHGNSTKEEAHANQFRTFSVVRDFLCVLDQVCKEVGKINERTVINSARQVPSLGNHSPAMSSFFRVYKSESQESEDDSSSSSS